MGILYPVIGVAMMGGMACCMVLGALGFIEVWGGASVNYLSFEDRLYKRVKNDEHYCPEDKFIHYVKGKNVGEYEWRK